MGSFSFLLRPSLLASLLVHVGLVVGALAWSEPAATLARPARVGTMRWSAALERAPEPESSAPELHLPEVEVTAPREPEADLPEAPPPVDEEPMPEEPSAPSGVFDSALLRAPALPMRRTHPSTPEARPARPVAPAGPPAAPAEPGRVLVSPRPLTSNLPPAYPAEARRHGWEGVAVLLVTVGLDGRVRSVSVERSSGHRLLDGAAEATVRSWSFSPPVVRGTVVDVTLRVPVAFRLT